MYYTTANHQIVFTDKDITHASTHTTSRWLREPDEQTLPRVAGVGRSIDELERVNGQWLIKSRNVAPMD